MIYWEARMPGEEELDVYLTELQMRQYLERKGDGLFAKRKQRSRTLTGHLTWTRCGRIVYLKSWRSAAEFLVMVRPCRGLCGPRLM